MSQEITEGSGKHWHEAYAAIMDGDNWEVSDKAGDVIVLLDGIVKYTCHVSGGIGILRDDVRLDYFATETFTIKRKQRKVSFVEAMQIMDEGGVCSCLGDSYRRGSEMLYIEGELGYFKLMLILPMEIITGEWTVISEGKNNA